MGIHRALHQAVAALAHAMEIRDPYTSGHQKRVSALARLIAQEMDLPRNRVEVVRLGATLHDIGKIGAPAEILAKPTRLSPAEMALIREHASLGSEILEHVDFDAPVATIVRQHHERLDGTGYPDGLRGDRILLEARIIAVADTVEAMASHRPYRPALGIDHALHEIRAQRGIKYDAAAVDACLALDKADKLEKLLAVSPTFAQTPPVRPLRQNR
jgi:putative nucleotidyltransferase with HDIG domain